MDQSFAGLGGDLPKTQTLQSTMVRAVLAAREYGHRVVTLEHLLHALIDDADADAVLSAGRINVAKLKNAVIEYLIHGLANLRAQSAAQPVLSKDVELILSQSASAADELGRDEYDGAIVLATIVTVGNSAAAQLLFNHGVTVGQVVQFVEEGLANPTVPSADAFGDADFDGMVPVGRIDEDREEERDHSSASKSDLPPPVRVPNLEKEPEPLPEAVQRRAREAGKPASELTVDELLDSVKEIIGVSDKKPAPETKDGLPPLPEYEGPSREAGKKAGASPLPPIAPYDPQSRPDYPKQKEAPQETKQWAPSEVQDNSVTKPRPPLPAGGPGNMEGQGGMPGGGLAGAMRPAPSPSPAAPSAPPRPAGFPGPLPSAAGGAPMQNNAEQMRRVEEGLSKSRAGAGMRPQRSLLEGAIEEGALAENIPRLMRVGIPVDVEVRIARSEIMDFDQGMSGHVTHHAISITEAMTVQMRAPQGGFLIESCAPETQWVGSRLKTHDGEFGRWRWTVRPVERGRKRLQLVLSARTVDERGLVAETVLPEQVIVVNVRINYGKTFKKAVGWLVAAVAGGALGHYGEGLMRWMSAILS